MSADDNEDPKEDGNILRKAISHTEASSVMQDAHSTPVMVADAPRTWK